MIQRIQSLWLLLVVIIAALSFKFSFYVGTWMDGGVQHLQEPLNAYHPSVLVMIATVAVVIISLIAIFMFKSRRQQFWLIFLSFLLSLLLIYLYYFEINKYFLPGSGTMALTSIFVFALPVFLFMAMRGVRRDMKLLRSADRLRD
ncbi:DUF4293 domain-containing protein [Arachidicoccus soli]|uniref:DUF4293 family protein n=1 Tax=Arachidicoccus soli TaxID=2341117 RepID=A0A386HT86_9BACT|nr:DUF4293 domain-containing protein [Arachidicoccus soli]AYD48494.1 DUF4293 family protein [Arachidicoccus soli]